jgi:hypothetical protein
MSLGLGALLGGAFNPMAGAGGPSKDMFFSNTDQVHKFDKPQESKGKTSLTSVTGQRDDTKPGETYIDFKAPTMVGTRSSIAYTKDMLSYKKKAEQAIDRRKIPKEHEKRVKQYFDSLTKGK